MTQGINSHRSRDPVPTRLYIDACSFLEWFPFRCGLQITMALRWRSDFEKYVIVHNFERRAKFWRRIDESVDDPNWNFYWANVHNVRALFSPESGTRLGKCKLFV